MRQQKRTSKSNNARKEVFGVITSSGEIIRGTISLHLSSVMAACMNSAESKHRRCRHRALLLEEKVVIGRDAAIFGCWNGTGTSACPVAPSNGEFVFTIVHGTRIIEAFYMFFKGSVGSPEESLRIYLKRSRPPAIMEVSETRFTLPS